MSQLQNPEMGWDGMAKKVTSPRQLSNRARWQDQGLTPGITNVDDLEDF